MESLLVRVAKAKSQLKKTETRVITPDGREIVENRRKDGGINSVQVGVRQWGFIGDFKPDLQMAEVSPGLFLSGQDPAHEIGLLKVKTKITHIVNCASIVENQFPMDFVYLRIDIYDLPSADLLSQLPKCIKFIKDAIASKGRVLVHCNAGVSRSSTIVLAYMMQEDGLSLDEALEKARSIRPAVKPNAGFMRQLRQFESQLNTSNSNDNKEKCEET